LAYAFLVPKNPQTMTLDSNSFGPLAVLSRELYGSFPAGTFRYKKDTLAKTQKLIVESGNPWNLTAQEFSFMKVVCAFIAFIVAWPVWFLIRDIITVPWFILVPLFTIFGFFVPQIKYADQAKRRSLDFTRELPEALDLMIISLSAGATFSKALQDTLPNMRDGVLKEEFVQMNQTIESGKSVNAALNDFAKRAPNESIITFVRAVQEANNLGVPLTDVLKARSEASREDFFALVHSRVATLESKIMVILTPTLLPTILLISIAPSANSLMGVF